ncbi:SGNH/GDSL hydrolase family protein [Piscinibacter sp. XHJ-5]|uniref:SGNH/GDSL hydrolase family protein n=1 Tax=Piscinibacter sp. XHJ-5 TaxID=3037797 RepID=UPI002452F18D|nr:SGNH/GDSL hydrolase family protein [Piscinibacter sp. XHJ-5]
MSGWGKAWALRWIGVLAGALMVAACGGGEQVEKFVPGRVLAFGDENSIIESDGRKYTINFLAAPTTEVPSPSIDCKELQIWVQILANSYSVPFPQCPVTGITTSPSRILATVGATVATVATQIDNFLLTDSFAGTDLVTIMVGTQDVLELYSAVEAGTMTIDQAALEAEARGTKLAEHVNRIAQAGAKVLISTIPDVGLTPFGRDTSTRATRTAEVSRLSDRLNSKARVGLINDGRMIGLVLTDQSFDLSVKAAQVNTSDPACDDLHLADVRTCTSQTLRTKDGVAATATSYLWADNLHMSPAGHTSAGTLAVQRAVNNPF